MNWLDGFNSIIKYIEEHIEEELNMDELAGMMGYSSYHFQRMFLMIAGVSLTAYIRSRRLSKAAEELLDSSSNVLDIALRYGYSSPNSFQRAFKAMHGLSPVDVRKNGSVIKAYPPLSFELTVKGAEAIEYRMVQLDDFRILGKKLHTSMEGGQSYMQIPAFWQETMQSGSVGQILSNMDAEPMGLLGISDYNPNLNDSEFDYYIAVSSGKPVPDCMDELLIPASTWAVFPHRNENPAAAQKFQQHIVMEWLPSSRYEFAKAPDVELYFEDGRMETWIPVVLSK